MVVGNLGRWKTVEISFAVNVDDKSLSEPLLRCSWTLQRRLLSRLHLIFDSRTRNDCQGEIDGQLTNAILK